MTPEEAMATSPGVAFTAPPADLLPAVNGQIATALAALKPGSKGALVAIATQSGVNAAIVAKLPHGFEVMSWIGKEWSAGPVYGAAVKVEW